MRWHIYRDWCAATGRHCLVIPQGIQGIEDDRWEEGYFYSNGQKIAPYMVIQRYATHDILIRFKETDNIHRFESHRWRLLVHLEALRARLAKVVGAIKLELSDDGHDYVAFGPVKEQWFKLVIKGDSESLKEFDSDKVGVLDRMATLTRSDREYELVASYELIARQLEKYYKRVALINKIMCVLFRNTHPHRRHPWGKPAVQFTVNGRNFVIDQPANIETSVNYWPTPQMRLVDLDSAARQELVGKLTYRV